MVTTEAGRRLSERMNGTLEWMAEAIEAIEREALANARADGSFLRIAEIERLRRIETAARRALPVISDMTMVVRMGEGLIGEAAAVAALREALG